MLHSHRSLRSSLGCLAVVLFILLSIGSISSAPPHAGSGRGGQGAAFYVPGEVLIGFQDDAGPLERANARALVNAQRLRQFRSGAEHWRLAGGETTEAAISRLRNQPHVRYAEPNYRVRFDLAPNDPRYDELYALNNRGQTGGTSEADIRAESAWNITTGTRSVVVAVIDTGVDTEHPDLQANVWTNPGEIPDNGIDDDSNGFIDDVHGWDFVNHDNNPFDDFGHGTHVAGTIGAVGDNGDGVVGVDWQVSIMALKFLGSDGSGTIADAIAAIDYATTMGAQILNDSWSGGGYSQALLDAINAAGAANILVVAAAGNDGSDNDLYPAYPSGYDAGNIVSVAASGASDQLADFSSYGATTVDLAAPGVNILSTLPGNSYGVYSGTSMATAHVSGVAALMRAMSPGIDVATLKRVLLESVAPIPALEGKTVSGGRLDAFRSLATLGNSASAPSTILVTPDSLAASVFTGETTTRLLTIRNNGASDVEYRVAIHRRGSAASTQISPAPQPYPTRVTLDPPAILPGLDSTTPPANYQPLLTGTASSPGATVLLVQDVAPWGLRSNEQVLEAHGIAYDRIPSSGLAEKDLSPYLLLIIPSDQPASLYATLASLAAKVDAFVSAGGILEFHAASGGWEDGDASVVTLPRGLRIVDRELSPTNHILIPSHPLVASVPNPFSATCTSFAHFGSIPAGAEQIGSDASGQADLLVYPSGSGMVVVGSQIFEWAYQFREPAGTILSNMIPYSLGQAPGWLTANPAMGVIAPGSSTQVVLGFDAAGLRGGVYTSDLVVSGSDPLVGSVAIPATLAVTGAPDLRLLGEEISLLSQQSFTTDGARTSHRFPVSRAPTGGGTLTVTVNGEFDKAAETAAFMVGGNLLGSLGGGGTRCTPTSRTLAVSPELLAAAVADGHLSVEVQNSPNVGHLCPANTHSVHLRYSGPAERLDFGPVATGLSRSMKLTVRNEGTDRLQVASIGTDSPAFSVSAGAMSLPPAESASLTVTFTTSTVGEFTGTVSLSSNDPDAPIVTIPLSGEGIAPPVVGAEPASLGATLFTGGAEDQNLRVFNTGASPLDFSLTVVPRLPEGTTCVPTRAFVADVYGGKLLSVDLTTGTATVVASGLSYPTGVAVSPDKTLAYVTQYGRNELSSVNLVTGSVNRLAGLSYPEGVALDSSGAHAFVTGYYGVLSSVDLSTGTVNTITTGLSTPIGVALSGSGTEAIVTNLYAGRLSRVNLSTGSITTVASGLQGPYGVAIDSTGTTAFVVELYSGRVLAITLASGAVRTVAAGLFTPYAIALDPAGVTAYVSESYDFLTAVDLATGIQRRFASGLSELLGIALNTGVSCQPVFMSPAPSSGSVPASGFLDIVAHFDARGLPGGTYLNDIRVASNDPVTPLLTIPATLNVISAPDLEVLPLSLGFPDTFVGYSNDLTLTARNVGTEPLHIGSVQLEGEFSQAGLTSPVIIPKNESRAITVTFSPTVPGPANGRLILNSDDPYQPALAVPLTGTALVPPLAGVAPSSLQTTLLTGSRETQTLTLTNTGGSDLNFSLDVHPAIPGPLSEAQVIPEDFQPLASSPVPLTCVVEDPASLMLYAQAYNGTAFYRYRAASDVWEPLAAAPLASGNSGGAALLNRKIYTAYTGNASLLGVYDIASNSWSTIHNPLGYGTAEIASDGARYLYLLIYASLVRLDPVSGVATMLPSALYSYSGLGVLRHLDGKLYLGPGGGGSDLAQIDLASNKWTDLGLMPGGTWIAAAIDPLARGLFTVGWGVDGFNNFFRYSIDSETWSVSAIPTFQVGDGGMGWLPGPVPGIYFVQGKDGTGFARLLTLAPFLSLSPTSGTVPAGGSTTIQAQFDAGSLPGAVYKARIDITSNDPVHPLVSVPAQLAVIGMPDIDAQPASLAFSQTFTGQSRSLSLIIQNRGTDTLHISGVRLEGEFVQTGLTPPLTLAMGEWRALTITYSPTVTGSGSGRLILDSDDPDEPAFAVPLSGTALPPPVMQVTPTSLSASLFLGTSETQTLTLANTGGSDLTFSLTPRVVTSAAASAEETSPTPFPVEQGAPGQYERLASSPAPLTCIVEDPANQVIYGQASSGTAFYRYRAESDSWETLAASPVYNSYCTAAILNGKLYTNGISSTLMGVYDIATNTWSTRSNPFGYGWGGIAGDGKRYLYLVQAASFLRLDPVSGEVTYLPAPPFIFTIQGGLHYLDGKLYGHRGYIFTGFARFDVASNAWTLLPPTPGAALLGATIDPLTREYFAYGGLPSSKLYRFSFDTQTWQASSLSLFTLGDTGGMGWLPGPVPAVYFVQGSGPLFARIITGVPFLTLGAVSGTVPPGGRAQIPVKFDAGILSPGTYRSNIQIVTNDPANSLLTVPGTLQVYGDTDLDGFPDPFDNCPALFNPDQRDTDGDRVGDLCDACTDTDQDGKGNPGFSANTCPLDNCPATANPDQLDTNHDGSGDACQPVLALSSILQDGGSALEVRALARDPQGEPLSGLVQVYETVSTPIVLHDAFTAGLCQSGLLLQGVSGEGIAFANVSFGVPLLFDMDAILACKNAQPDFEIARGFCSAPTSAFDFSLDLSNLALPAPICVRTTSIPRTAFEFSVSGFDATSLTLRPGSAAPSLLTYPFATWPPRGDSIASLTRGATYRIKLVLSDGNTVPVSAEGTFLYQGESILLFNNPPAAHAVSDAGPVECDRPGGGPVTLHASSSTDSDSSPGTHDDIARFDWTLDAGQPAESPLGSGEDLTAVVPLGAHTVTLLVTDAAGESDSTSIPVSVVDTTPPLVSCPGAETLECTSPAGAPAAIVAAASDVCDPAVAIQNSWNSWGADASGVYPLGASPITFTASDLSGNSATCDTRVTVRDSVPPLLTIAGSPTQLWPPNHRLVPVAVLWQATDVCTLTPTVRLISATSSELDDAPGDGDGTTTDDVSGADLGTADTEVSVRAERAGTGIGRTYELKYESADAAGNVSGATVLIQVPHDTAPGADPMQLHLESGGTAGSAWIFWDPVPGAKGYDLIMGDLANVRSKPNLLALGQVTVLASGTEATDYLEAPGGPGPSVGQAWFFVMQYRQVDGTPSGYGSVFAALPREPNSCGAACP